MDLSFKFPVNISNNNIVYCKELINKNLLDIQKYILLNDNNLICDYFDNLSLFLISNKNVKINYIDKFLILLNARINCIGSFLEVLSKDKIKTAVDLKPIADKILKNFISDQKFVSYKNYKIYYNVPTHITENDTIFDFINEVEYNGLKVSLGDLSSYEKEEIIENLPTKIVIKLGNNLKNNKIIPVKLFDFRSNGETKTIFFDYSIDSIMYMLKLLYNNSLDNLHYEQYICSRKINISPSEYLNLSPNETKLLLKTLSKEYEKNNTEQSNKKSSMPTHGYANAGV